jgi:hypothetical protein
LRRTNEKSIMDELFEMEITPEEMFQGISQENEVVEEVEETIEDEVIEEVEEEESSSGAKVFYDFITENGLIDEIENFDGNVETLKQHLEQLPVKSFKRAVDSLPEFAQQIVNYAFSKELSNLDDFKDFMENVVKPAYSQVNVDDVESARTYLQSKYTEMGIYAEEDDLLEAIDLLEEKGNLLKTAKSLADKDNEASRKALELKVKEAEETKVNSASKLKEEQEKFSKGIEDTFKELNWKEERKKAVFQNLQADVVNRKNNLIRKSPKAIVQLADIYSYFNEEKGEFDFSKLIDVKAQSKQTVNKKEDIQRDKFSSSLASLGKETVSKKNKSLLEVIELDYEE